MTAMRITHVLAPAPVGGLERVVQGLATAQRNAGNDVEVLAVLPKGEPDAGPFLTPLRRYGVGVHTINLPARAYRAERQAIFDHCAAHRPAVVHTHGAHVDVVAADAGRAVGAAMVTTMHGITGGDWRNRGYEWLQVRACARRDAVVAVARQLATRLIDAGIPPERLHVVRNAWQPDGDRDPLDREEARRRLGLDPNAFIAGWVGRMSPEKGLDVLVEALPAVDAPPLDASGYDGRRPVGVAIIGDGAERGRLQARAAALAIGGPRVDWLGHVPDAARLLRAFDVLVLSSRSEGTPMTLLEAMAAEVPVVATRVGGVPDVVGDDEALLVPPDEPAVLAAAIRSVRDDRATARRRARAALLRLRRDGDPTLWAARYRYVYEAALETANARRAVRT